MRTATSSVCHKQRKRAGGKLVIAATVGQLRTQSRVGAPAGTLRSRLPLAAALCATVAVLGALWAPAVAHGQSGPDAYPTKTPSAPSPAPDPAPDPAPTAVDHTAAAPEPQQAPASPPPPPSIVQETKPSPKPTATPRPKPRTTRPEQRRVDTAGPTRPRAQLASTPASERPTLALPVLASPDDDGSPLPLALLAFLALALASANLVYLLLRTNGPWRRA